MSNRVEVYFRFEWKYNILMHCESFQVGPLPSLAGVLSSLMIQLILCHWKSLKKPHVAMIKLLVIGCILFGFGTLPWQANFTGLIAGLIFGIGITLTFVPFVNVAKHSRKSKVSSVVFDAW